MYFMYMTVCCIIKSHIYYHIILIHLKKSIFHADKLNFNKNKQGRIKIDYCKDCKEPFGLMRECVFFLFCVKYTCTCRNGILVKIINATEKIFFVFECVNLTDYSTCIYFLKGIDIFIQL